MPRLSQSAYDLMVKELERLWDGKPLEKVRYDIAIKRLQKLRQQEGPPTDYTELKNAVDDVFPEFRDSVLKQAAKRNRPHPAAAPARWLLGLGFGTAAAAGFVWFVNLPYPMVRWPVAENAPMLLLPSFMRMDHSYRQAIIYTEQADQLINSATSSADIELGAEKAAEAQKYLDRLPVWFLDYYPKLYCRLFGCSWRFTLDEFREARELIGRMDAQVFQEENAFELLEENTLVVDTALNRYESFQTPAERQGALAMAQDGIDKLDQIPTETLAGRQAQKRIEAYRRDHSILAGATATASRSDSLVEVAKGYASQAVQIAQNPPHGVSVWSQAESQWQEAIRTLERVPEDSPSYVAAQALRAEYLANKGAIATRKQQEKEAVALVNRVRDRAVQLTAQAERRDRQGVLTGLTQVIQQLDNVPAGTTVTAEAQQLRRQAQAQLQQLQSAN